MRFLLDEMLPRELLSNLKTQGHEGFLLADLRKQGISNGALVKLAAELQAITITCDSDFLLMKKSLQQICRIIYIKVHPRNPPKIVRILKENLNYCITQLQQPGRVTLTETERIFESF